MTVAPLIHAAEQTYRGSITKPEHWDSFQPRCGDVLLATPAKSGTTWTQSMIAMLLYGTVDLPEKLGVLSPWIDGGFGTLEDSLASLDRQTGRRVIKTHTPTDGFPVWKDVPVIAVFRHPLEVFLSLRKHLANAMLVDEHPMLGPVDQALPDFLEAQFDSNDVDSDSLASIIWHFEQVALSTRNPAKLVLNYARMSRDHAGTVARLDAFLGTEASPELQAAITQATDFGAMKTRAADFAPEANNDLWHDDKAFFAGGRSGHWREAFTDDQIAAYHAAFESLLPDPGLRHWIETGEGNV